MSETRGTSISKFAPIVSLEMRIGNAFAVIPTKLTSWLSGSVKDPPRFLMLWMIFIFLETGDNIITTRSRFVPKSAKRGPRLEYVDQDDFRADRFSFKVSFSFSIMKDFLQVFEISIVRFFFTFFLAIWDAKANFQGWISWKTRNYLRCESKFSRLNFLKNKELKIWTIEALDRT